MADVLASELKTYLGTAGRQPFYWGELDCFLFVADWVLQVKGTDPAGAFRGAYTTSREARSIMKARGGALRCAHSLMIGAGCAATDAPEIGDAALVRAAVGYRGRLIFLPVGAICLRQNMWAIKSAEASLTIGAFPVIRAWSVSRD